MNLKHIAWVRCKSQRMRALSMPCVMVQQVNGNNQDEVHLAFGLKMKKNQPRLEFVCAAGFKSKGWFGGWNWQFEVMNPAAPGYARIVRISDRDGKFCYEAPMRRFNVVSGGWICEKQIANHSSSSPSYNRTTVAAESMLLLIESDGFEIVETENVVEIETKQAEPKKSATNKMHAGLWAPL